MTLTVADITELKNILRPTETIAMVMAAVAPLFGEASPEWSTCKQLLSRQNFLAQIHGFDVSKVDSARIAKL